MKVYYPDYRLALSGQWSEKDRANLQAGIVRTGAALTRFTHLYPDQSFFMLFGALRAGLSKSLQGMNAYTSADQSIVFVPEKITEALVIHELGHVLALRYPQALESLLRHGVRDKNGHLVTGTTCGGYYRYAGLRCPENGYYSNDWTKGHQIHPGWMEGGMSVSEDFADIWLNWVRHSFVDNLAGAALYSWVDGNISDWIAELL